MRNKFLLTISILVLVVGLFTGMVFAIDESNGEEDLKIQSLSYDEVEKNNEPWNINSANNIDSKTYREMLNLMRTNGFSRCSRFMQTGNYQDMNEWMNNLSQEDFETMRKLMEDSGYTDMTQMMNVFGVDGMFKMHNSSNGFKGRGMMGNW